MDLFEHLNLNMVFINTVSEANSGSEKMPNLNSYGKHIHETLAHFLTWKSFHICCKHVSLLLSETFNFDIESDTNFGPQTTILLAPTGALIVIVCHYIDIRRQLFEILSISANIFSFSF